MQLKIRNTITKPKPGLWWQKFYPCLFCLSNISLAVGYITLLFYCLVWKAGKIVDVPSKIIGFYNFCLLDQEAEILKCLKDYENIEINMTALVLSRICVYTTPVLCLFAACTVLKALCMKDMDLWKLACFLLAVSSLLLPVGLALFFLDTKKWLKVSEAGEVFVGLLGAHVFMLLHMITIVLYLAVAQSRDSFQRKEISCQKHPV